MIKNYLLIIALILLHTTLAFSQKESTVRRYATQIFMDQMLKENAKFKENQAQIETYIKEYSITSNPKKVTIPLVFHIIQSPNQSRIELSAIEQQIAILNNSFLGDSLAESFKQRAYTKAGFDKKAALSEIDFCFATPPPGSEEQSPVVYYTTSVKEWPVGNTLKKAIRSPWDTKKYLNIWVATLSDGFAGFAQMPGGPEDSDGIVIDARFFVTENKTKYSRGMTLTHLVGSYLGLYELWNEKNYCGDDFVEDTPIHNGPNYGKPIYKHVSLCDGNPVEMTMNFMDNTDDDMLTMFTSGQKLRMQAILSEKGPRGGLGDNLTKCKKEKFDASLLDFDATTNDAYFDLKVFPNPANDRINVDVKMMPLQKEARLWILNAAGSLIQEKSFSESTALEFLTAQWPQGIYTIKLISLDGQSKVQRVLITH